jgi:hypothetical protein
LPKVQHSSVNITAKTFAIFKSARHVCRKQICSSFSFSTNLSLSVRRCSLVLPVCSDVNTFTPVDVSLSLCLSPYHSLDFALAKAQEINILLPLILINVVIRWLSSFAPLLFWRFSFLKNIYLFIFIHLFTSTYTVWVIFPPLAPAPPHSPASRQNLFCSSYL